MSFRDDLDEQRQSALAAVRDASRSWSEAMRAHTLAPPDHEFGARLRQLASAATAEQRAWLSAQEVGLVWRPIPGAEHAQPPYELRPGTGRRGPAEVWTRFDLAVARLNRAISGSDSSEVAAAFGEVAEVTGKLADSVAREDELRRDLAPGSARAEERARSRGAA